MAKEDKKKRIIFNAAKMKAFSKGFKERKEQREKTRSKKKKTVTNYEK